MNCDGPIKDNALSVNAITLLTYISSIFLGAAPMDLKSGPPLSGARLICHREAAPGGRSSVHARPRGLLNVRALIFCGDSQSRWVVFTPRCSVSCFISRKYWAIELSSSREQRGLRAER